MHVFLFVLIIVTTPLQGVVDTQIIQLPMPSMEKCLEVSNSMSDMVPDKKGKNKSASRIVTATTCVTDRK